ncbi:putative sigma-54 modulation protein [Pontibacter ummariensis]|uniref:Putative sigma-54 modulation protein n=1 Tax=Pontibacter ummariensis TaxID=1610492 RepID=A0A239HB93_9BACT|nr:ribosome-associated translation inhibitor RaiA [Pontibacter ummariensis]PRY10691.1 putative sigma-54 modulation protein [Pontibacter ummariensis]SNS78063.1 putative sigma-54 modulation protein [Pontibacter ummariensis]
MKVQMYSINFEASEQLKSFIQQRLNKLETFYDRILDGEVFIKDNSSQSGTNNKEVEVRLFVPGTTLFSQENADSFEAATDAAVDAMRRQLKKLKDKQTAH